MSILGMRNWLKSGKYEKAIWIILLIVFGIGCFAGYGAYTGVRGGAQAGPGEYDAAVVYGDTISGAALEKAFDAAWKQQQQGPYPPTTMMEEMVRQDVLNQMIDGAMWVHEAKSQGIDIDRKAINDEIEKRVAERVQMMGGGNTRADKDLDEKLRKYQNTSLDEFKNKIRSELQSDDSMKEIESGLYFGQMIEKLKATAGIKLTDEEFNRRFRQVNARWIMISERGVSEAQAKKRIDDVAAELAKGGDFAALAAKYSNDPMTAKKGGLMQPMTAPIYDAGLENALYTTGAGNTSKPVKVQGGYAIVKVESISAPKYPNDFAKNRKQLFDSAQNEKLRAKLGEMDQELQKKAKDAKQIEIKDPIVSAFQKFQTAMQMDSRTPAQKAAREKALRQVIKAYEAAYKATSRPAIQARIGMIYKSELKDKNGKPESDKALAAYNKALESAADPALYIQVAEIYKEKGDTKAAIAAYDSASDAAYGPSSDFMHRQIRQAFQQLGDAKRVAKEDGILKDIAAQQAEMQKRQQEMLQQQLAAQKAAAARKPAAKR